MAFNELTSMAVTGKHRDMLLQEAITLPKIDVDDWTSSDIGMIGNGALSPLTGFMCQRDYLSVIRDMHLADGSVWPLPITLALVPSLAKSIRVGDRVSLRCPPDQSILAILTVEDIFRYDREHESMCTFRTKNALHPGVRRIMAQGDILLGGTLQVLCQHQHPNQPYPEYRLEPSDTRKAFSDMGWRTVAGFQTGKPIYRAHEYMHKCVLEIIDGLFIHPATDWNDDDVPPDVRVSSYKTILEQYYPADRVLMGIYPGAMRYAGPREAVFHALVLRNYGCTHYIVSRDYSGEASLYGTYDTPSILSEFRDHELGIIPLFFEHTFHCSACRNMASTNTCPHDASNHIHLSGSVINAMLREGLMPPPEVIRPEAAGVLMSAHGKTR